MKNTVIVVVLLLMSARVVRSQQFEEKFSIPLPGSIKSAQVEWVDLDNDGLLDILVLSKNRSDESHMFFAKGDTLTTPFFFSPTTPIIDFQEYLIADYDRDNTMDVVVSGLRNGQPATVVYLGKGDFTFDEVLVPIPAF